LWSARAFAVTFLPALSPCSVAFRRRQTAIVGGFFPFHLDFVRGGAAARALRRFSAGPGLRSGSRAAARHAARAHGSITSILGAMAGLALPASVVQAALGVLILMIAGLMWRSKKTERPEVPVPDPLGAALGMHGVFHDAATREDVAWRVHRTPLGLVLFAGIGFMAGMFGLGAGWANVPVLNLVMGVPLRVSVSTSGFLLSVIDTSAWVYVNRGALPPMLVVPSILGAARRQIGGRLLRTVHAATIRKLVICRPVAARVLAKGLDLALIDGRRARLRIARAAFYAAWLDVGTKLGFAALVVTSSSTFLNWCRRGSRSAPPLLAPAGRRVPRPDRGVDWLGRIARLEARPSTSRRRDPGVRHRRVLRAGAALVRPRRGPALRRDRRRADRGAARGGVGPWRRRTLERALAHPRLTSRC
jgi:uncharacterized membrane protein YfcA